MANYSRSSFLMALGLFLVAQASQQARAGDVVAEDSLRPEITSSIMTIEHLRAPDCATPKIVSTTAIQPPPDQSQKAERWKIDRCGNPASYVVEYLEPAPGRISYMVKEEAQP